MKTPFQRILGINLVLMLLVVIVALLPRGMNNRLGAVIISAGAFVVLFIINAGFAVFSETAEEKRAHLLSLLLLFLIGFGNCALQFSI